MRTVSKGTVPFRGHRTWYQVVGELPAPEGKLPVLVLHGGPGFPHDYLEDLAGLADAGLASKPILEPLKRAAFVGHTATPAPRFGLRAGRVIQRIITVSAVGSAGLKVHRRELTENRATAPLNRSGSSATVARWVWAGRIPRAGESSSATAAMGPAGCHSMDQ
jgi:hypothetical protein